MHEIDLSGLEMDAETAQRPRGEISLEEMVANHQSSQKKARIGPEMTNAEENKGVLD